MEVFDDPNKISFRGVIGSDALPRMEFKEACRRENGANK